MSPLEGPNPQNLNSSWLTGVHLRDFFIDLFFDWFSDGSLATFGAPRPSKISPKSIKIEPKSTPGALLGNTPEKYRILSHF